MGSVGGLIPSPLHMISLTQVALGRWLYCLPFFPSAQSPLFCLLFFPSPNRVLS
jgi:hypothetical protein